jgi:hypothetical protein
VLLEIVVQPEAISNPAQKVETRYSATVPVTGRQNKPELMACGTMFINAAASI